jgi:hypothetical protein
MSGELPPATARAVVEALESEIVDLDAAAFGGTAGTRTGEDAVRIVPGSPEPTD